MYPKQNDFPSSFQFWIFKRYHLHHHPWSCILNPHKSTVRGQGRWGKIVGIIKGAWKKTCLEFAILASKAKKKLQKLKASVLGKFSVSSEDSFRDFWNQIEENGLKAEVTVLYYHGSCIIRGLDEKNTHADHNSS